MLQLLLAAVIIALAHGVTDPPPMDAEIVNYNYHVTLESHKFFLCSGVIISPDYILTAAHCVERKTPNLLQVRVGSAKIREGGNLVNVDKIFVHPHYKEQNGRDHDLSILKLAKPLQFSPEVGAVELPDYVSFHSVIKEGTITGFGHTSSVSLYQKKFPEVLQAGAVTIPELKKCVHAYAEIGLRISDDMICAGGPEEGAKACVGDGGSPLVFQRRLVGVLSWGGICHKWQSPTVFADVAMARGFIASVTGL